MKKQKAALLVLLSLLGTVWAILRFSPYPDLKKFKSKAFSTAFYDCKGNLIQVSSLEGGIKREFTPLKKIPKDVRRAFIKSEDKRFYLHNGIDYLALANALFENLRQKENVRGASTITMQLVKIISEDTQKRSYSQKLIDMFNALRLESRLSKNKILEYYLNSVPFGMNCEGVTSAARSFYGKKLSELTKDEIKCLSVIPRRPSLYNPIENPLLCAQRAKVPLEAASSAYRYSYPFYMPHYISYVKKYYREKGLDLPANVYLNCDLELQQLAKKYLRQALNEAQASRISNGALLIMENKSGNILCWIGNENWYDSSNSGQIDGVLVNNQPGSSMKPFLYLYAMELKDGKGEPLMYPSRVLADVPTEFGNSRLYIPSNFNNKFNGPVRMRVALASSLNIPAVSCLNECGVDGYLDFLYDLGFDSLRHGGKEADLGLSLGAGEVNLTELVPAFSTIVRDGNYLPLEYSGLKAHKVYSSDSARLMCSILSDSSSRALGFGYSQTFQTDYPSIFKTGTANQYQNIIALGATKNYTIGVWMGNFSGKTVIGKTGSSLPAWIAKNLLDYLEKDHVFDERTSFAQPEGYHLQKICPLSGLPAGPDCPGFVYEYLKDDMKFPLCSWHKETEEGLQITYPAEYQRWLLDNEIKAQIDYSLTPLTILSPQNDALFYYSELYNAEQAIPVEITGGTSNSLEIYYDGKYYDKISRPFYFKLPVERGSHTLEVHSGLEECSIKFLVK